MVMMWCVVCVALQVCDALDFNSECQYDLEGLMCGALCNPGELPGGHSVRGPLAGL